MVDLVNVHRMRERCSYGSKIERENDEMGYIA